MSWGYWGIVISLGTLIVMLLACMRLLASNDKENQQESRQGAGGSVDMTPQQPPTISRRAA
jgi:hypothetical protein